MINQLLFGSFITLVSLSGAAVLWWVLNTMLERLEPWLRRPPHAQKSLAVVMMVIVCTMIVMTVGVWIWAAVFLMSGVFGSLEEALFFALVAYTTLGLGDVQIRQESRLLGGMVGANGFLMFGLMTAMLTDTLRHVRRVQQLLED